VIFFKGLYPDFVKEKIDEIYEGLTFEEFKNPHNRLIKKIRERMI